MTTQDQNTLSYAAGWYADTANPGSERYYDGAAWSQETRPATATPPAKPKKKRKWPWIAACAGIALVAIIAISASNTGGSTDAVETDSVAVTEEVAPAPAEEAAPAEPVYTLAQENALESAQSYLDLMPFSRQGLIDQLSSEYGSGFDVETATWAADTVGADWNAEAAEAAQSYLDTMAFSRDGLYEQLISEYGSKFTPEQAEAGLAAVGY